MRSSFTPTGRTLSHDSHLRQLALGAPSMRFAKPKCLGPPEQKATAQLVDGGVGGVAHASGM